MSNLDTIVGLVTHVGPFTWDEHVHIYSAVEIETEGGRRILKDVVASNDLDRAIAPRKSVALLVLQADPGSKAKSSILGAYDKDEQRLFFNEEMYKLRDHAAYQALVLSFLGIFAIPLGLAFFVIPGLLYIHALWKAWTSIKLFPTADEVRVAVERLPAVSP